MKPASDRIQNHLENEEKTFLVRLTASERGEILLALQDGIENVYACYGRRVMARRNGQDEGNPDNPSRRIERVLALVERISAIEPEGEQQ
jgi:hypothetical protein